MQETLLDKIPEVTPEITPDTNELTETLISACNCHPEGSKSRSCDQDSRQCHCRRNVQGRRCNMCVAGYQNFPECQLPTWAIADEAVVEFSNASAVLFGFTPYSHFQYPSLNDSFRNG